MPRQDPLPRKGGSDHPVGHHEAYGRRVIIEGVYPEIDCGRFPIKRVVAEPVVVEADIFTDGHDLVSAALLYRREDEDAWAEVPMESLVNDRWRGSFAVDEPGRWRYTLIGWVDAFGTWKRDLARKVEAGQDVSVDLRIGAELIEAAAGRAAASAGPPAAGSTPGVAELHGHVARRPVVRNASGLRAESVAERPVGASPAADAERLRAWAQMLGAPAPASTKGEPGDPGQAKRGAEPPGEGARRVQDEAEPVLDEVLAALVAAYPDRRRATTYARELGVVVDRERARFGSWYEFFPRSASSDPDEPAVAHRTDSDDPVVSQRADEAPAVSHRADPDEPQAARGADRPRHATFRDAEAMLPYIAGMGFDVVYLPPIHPIGQTHRKGKNNAPEAEPGDVGSPWAIGAETGGHTALHLELGTLDDFRRFVRRAYANGLEVALDIAFQASPDHPWTDQHPEWFRRRPDGTIQYAENPPKKYEDIYPFDFEAGESVETSAARSASPAARSEPPVARSETSAARTDRSASTDLAAERSDAPSDLWQALLDVVLFWHRQGVRIFRVDNPHTKPLHFWEWLIAEVKARDLGVIFLSEAFTRPKPMYRLAKLGFTQSYTYFAWRNTKWELEQYFTELTRTEVREYFRPNLWPNTPDILTEYLQTGGRPAFVARLVLAATLGASYGIYGPAFELCEARAREPGSEEYLDSEKYQLRHWPLDRPDSLRELIARVNRIRREERALQGNDTLRFHPVDNELLIAYTKHAEALSGLILVVVNLDPHHVQSGWLDLPLAELGIAPDEPFEVCDLLAGGSYLWQGSRNYVELNPAVVPAHIFRVRRRVRTERDFEYFM